MAAEASKSTSALKFLRDLIVIVLSALLAAFLLKTFLIRSFYIPSGSMENTLHVNDRVIVNQLAPELVQIKRGDIVVFRDPGGWLHASPAPELHPLQKALQFIGLSPDVSNDYLIKRVIGVGGDRVTCCGNNGYLEVNGVAIDEPYTVIPPGETAASGLEFDVTVPEGYLWLLGDNRYASKDSRYNQDLPSKGFVSAEHVVGKAFLLNWPLDRLRILESYPEVFADVPEPDTAQETTTSAPRHARDAEAR